MPVASAPCAGVMRVSWCWGWKWCCRMAASSMTSGASGRTIAATRCGTCSSAGKGRSASSPPRRCSMVPALKRVESAFVAVPSPDAALSLLSRVMGSGAELIGFELCARFCMEMAAKHGVGLRMPLPLEAPWYVMVEIAAAHERAVARHAGGGAGRRARERRGDGRRHRRERGAARHDLEDP
ncbi:FAD-linked oxidase C-terminal domain-containing protein [Dankookia sp. P2]|uniref:FAD-linked oxidase C-terminal domain-containing protein n=1 Tax=Dankookia sp. P2 TaxID=3423955 RepID=UPI003D677061